MEVRLIEATSPNPSAPGLVMLSPAVSTDPEGGKNSAPDIHHVDVNSQTSFDTFSSYYYTQADMVVPYAEHPIGTCSGGWFWGSEWTGFDGWYTSDVVQAGVEFDSYCGYPTFSQFYSAWYEWYPNGEVRISNFPITAGDDIYVEVWNTSATQAWLWMVNLNNDQVVEIGFNPPAGTSMVGNSAEWVVERPNLGNSITTLTNYVDIPFWDVIAEYRTGAFSDISGAYEVDMLDNAGGLISYPEYEGTESFVMHDCCSAYQP